MFEINKLYDFTTIAPTILGNSFKKLKVFGITNAVDAIRYSDIHNTNEQILTMVGNILPSVSTMTFIIFVNSDGEKVVLSLDWIDANSIQLITKTDLQITAIDISNIDMESIISVLKNLGIVNLDIKMINN